MVSLGVMRMLVKEPWGQDKGSRQSRLLQERSLALWKYKVINKLCSYDNFIVKY